MGDKIEKEMRELNRSCSNCIDKCEHELRISRQLQAVLNLKQKQNEIRHFAR